MDGAQLQASEHLLDISDVNMPLRDASRETMAFKNARKKQCSQLKVMSQMKFLNKLELELLRIDVANESHVELRPERPEGELMDLSDDSMSEGVVFEEEDDARGGRRCNPRRVSRSPKFHLPLPAISSNIAKPTGISPRSPCGSPRLRNSPRRHLRRSQYRPHSISNEPLQLTDIQNALTDIDDSISASLRKTYSFNEGSRKYGLPPDPYRNPSLLSSPRSAFAPHS